MRFALALSLCLAALAAAAPPEPEMRPFVMRWDDNEPSVLDLSFLSPGDAGADGPVVVSDEGYLATDSGRLKLFGNNIAATTVFADDVTDEMRDRFAGRLRKFGFNAMRLHHLEASWAQRNVFGVNDGSPNDRTTDIDPESLDRLHKWVKAFRDHGIYTNANLLVSRTFREADGLPASIEDVEWKTQGAIAIWHPAMIELQKDYARQLLSPVNPHTGVSLADDPSLCTVEINNENGILHTWLMGDVDAVPEDLAEPLRAMWNVWLAEKYADEVQLAEAWGARDVPLGEPLINGFGDGWGLNVNEAAVARVDTNADGDARIRVMQPGTAGWHVQYTHAADVKGGQPYTLTFRAKANAERTITVGLRMNHEPWNMLGLERRITLTPEFQDFSITFVPTSDDPNPRIEFGDLSQEDATYQFADLSLRPGGKVGGTTTLGEIPIPEQGGDEPMTTAQRRDWFAFCMDAEREYFGEMRRFLKDDLGVVAPVVGTIAGCSPLGVQKEMDAIDTHAYWRHPDFPGEPWDMNNWVVRPDSMVDFPENSAILGPMLKQVRVDGRRLPHMLTEYDHPAPNPHAGEGPLFLAAYAALQDFDAIYLFAYDVNFDEEPGKITSFFDTANHPTTMANCIPAALMFRRGDVQPAEEERPTAVTDEDELDALVERGAAWRMVDYSDFHGTPMNAYVSRVFVDFSKGAYLHIGGDPADDEVIQSEDGQFLWLKPVANEAAGATEAGLAIFGGAIDQLVHIGVSGVLNIGSGDPMGDDFEPMVEMRAPENSASTISLLRLSEQPLNHEGSKRALLIATGGYANTGWRWKSDDRQTLGTNWGSAPTLIEVVPVTLMLKADKAAKAWALDAVGRRVEEVAVELNDGTATLRVGPGHTETATLFYEIEWE